MNEQTKTQEIHFISSQLNELKTRVEKYDLANQIGNNFLARFDEKLNNLSKTMDEMKILVSDNILKNEEKEIRTSGKIAELEKDIANTKGKFWGIGLGSAVGGGGFATFLMKIFNH